MALFPAFSDPSAAQGAGRTAELDWLTNKSFRSDDALALHQRAVEKTNEGQDQAELRNVTSEEEEKKEEGRDAPPKKKKKKEKKKKKKKKHNSSGSDSDTIYPRDLKTGRETDSVSSVFCWLDEVQSPGQFFCLDRKPDAANWTYKSLYRGDIARYRRKGRSSLGLDPRTQEVSWAETEPDRKQKGGAKRREVDRYFTSANQLLLRSEPAASTLPKVPEEDDVSESFIPIGGEEKGDRGENKGNTADRSLNPLGVYDASTALWLQGKGSQRQTHSQDRQTDSQDRQTDSHDRQTDSLLAGRREFFNRKLREDSTNVQLWMEFIRYQDDRCSELFEGEEHRGRPSFRVLLEKKLSIAERALTFNPSSLELQLQRLAVGRELWEPSVLDKEWKKLVFLHPNSAPMWRQYLLFTQRHFSTFTVSKVNSAYGKCLSALSAVVDGTMVSHPVLPGTQEHMLDIVVQQCEFLLQTGQSEKAVSLFQALIDFNFYTPDSLTQLSTRQQVEFFEPFWDSGEARVGEGGARGWKAWMLQQERGGWIHTHTEEEEEEEEEGDEVKDQSLPRWKIWLDVESSREAAHWLPWRPDKSKNQSEEDCEDPDRQVLFDDIGPSLIRLSSPDQRFNLLLCFLSFLGLPVEAGVCGAPFRASLPPDSLSLLTHGNDPERPLTCYDLPDYGVSSVGHMTTLEGTRKWAGLGKLGEEFVTNVFHMILPLLPPHHKADLSLSWIQYEKLKVMRCVHGGIKKRLRAQGKSSKRVAKQLLKEPGNRSSLRLWREYAHLEWLLGNHDDARKVFTMATEMGGAKGLADPALCELCLLWAQLEVEHGGKDGGTGGQTVSPAVGVLTRLAEGSSSSSQSPSPVSVLKARRCYDHTLPARLSAVETRLQDTPSNTKEVEGWSLRGLVGCFALFQYLTVSIQAATAIYSQARDTLEGLHRKLKLSSANLANSHANISPEDPGLASRHHATRLACECEALAVQQALLLRYHTNSSVYPLAPLRQALNSGLSAWPCSAPLWSIYTQVESRYHGASRARRFFLSVVRGNDNVVPRLFAIVAEQQRKQLLDSAQRSGYQDDILPTLPETGLSNRILGLFESTIATENGARCPLVWRLYMHFLMSEGKEEKARGIFYKALQDIPWAKGLYLDAVQLFPGRLQEFVDLMVEKELRVRLPLEELDILLD